MVTTDIPYLVTDFWWDQHDVYRKSTMRNMISGFNDYTNGESVVKIYSAHQQLNPIKKRIEKMTDLKTSKNPYFWIYPRNFYKVKLKPLILTRSLLLILFLVKNHNSN